MAVEAGDHLEAVEAVHHMARDLCSLSAALERV